MNRLSSLILLAVVATGAGAGCRNDPAVQDIIDSLGEEKGTPSAKHRPGQPCLACHSKYGGAQPEMAVGGTVYSLDLMTKKIAPAKDIRVYVLDSSGNSGTQKKACTNEAGNFWVPMENWADITYPLTPTAGGLTMVSLVGRDGSCASCHKLPDDTSLDPVSGAGRDSAGVIIVDAKNVDPDCGGGGT
jgi:hypothetical protein